MTINKDTLKNHFIYIKNCAIKYDEALKSGGDEQYFLDAAAFRSGAGLFPDLRQLSEGQLSHFDAVNAKTTAEGCSMFTFGFFAGKSAEEVTKCTGMIADYAVEAIDQMNS